MQVAKWGNSLAVRIPADVARALGLKEGDEIELRAASDGTIEVMSEAQRREHALASFARARLGAHILHRHPGESRDPGPHRTSLVTMGSRLTPG